MVTVIDNAVPEILFNRVVNSIIDNNMFVYGINKTGTQQDSYYSMSSLITGGTYHSALLETSLDFIMRKVEISYSEILRVRVGCIPRDIKQVVNRPHVDTPDEHKVVLLYLNESDGDTHIYKNIAAEVRPETFELEAKISPKPNRAIIFDGKHYHSSQTPTICQMRYAVNYNVV